jgi:hypothetical protein
MSDKNDGYKVRNKFINIGFHTQNAWHTVCLTTRLSARLSLSFENPELVAGDLRFSEAVSSNFQLWK